VRTFGRFVVWPQACGHRALAVSRVTRAEEERVVSRLRASGHGRRRPISHLSHPSESTST
jgi:hypothetical protein